MKNPDLFKDPHQYKVDFLERIIETFLEKETRDVWSKYNEISYITNTIQNLCQQKFGKYFWFRECMVENAFRNMGYNIKDNFGAYKNDQTFGEEDFMGSWGWTEKKHEEYPKKFDKLHNFLLDSQYVDLNISKLISFEKLVKSTKRINIDKTYLRGLWNGKNIAEKNPEMEKLMLIVRNSGMNH